MFYSPIKHFAVGKGRCRTTSFWEANLHAMDVAWETWSLRGDFIRGK